MPQDLDITIANEPVKLLAERAALLVDRGTLIVADLHLGTPETHRSLAVSMPEGIAEEALDRLERIVAKWHPKRLTLLGDLVQLAENPDGVVWEHAPKAHWVIFPKQNCSIPQPERLYFDDFANG